MKIKVMITGATGMVGRGVLLECLDSDQVASVLSISRQSVNMSHPKLKEIIHKDFFDVKPIQNEFKGYHACFFCLGVSSFRMSEADYSRITYDLTVNFAQVVQEVNPDLVFCYVSGAGTDSSEQGNSMWARVKGKTENALLALPFKDAYMFRPGYIQPMKGVQTKTPIYNLLLMVSKRLYPLFKRLFPNYTTNTIAVGQAMINVGLQGYSKKHIESADINRLAAE